MRHHSTAFARAVASDAETVAKVDVYDRAGTPVWTDLAAASATVACDRSRDVRWTSDVTLAVPHSDAPHPWVPQSLTDVLSPVSGATYRVRVGFRYGDGTTETVPCGVYYPQSVTATETAAGVTVDLGGEDLSGRLNRADFTVRQTMTAGTNVVAAIKALVTAALPAAQFRTDTTTTTIAAPGLTWEPEANRLAEIAKLADSIGMDFWVDADGVFRLHGTPTENDAEAVVWAPAGLLSVSNAIDDDKIINGVVARGESVGATTSPPTGTWWEQNLANPLHYVPGPPVRTIIGPRPAFVTSPLIMSNAQAVLMAFVEYRRRQGRWQHVEFTSRLHPALDVGDVVLLNRPRVGVAGRYLVRSWNFTVGAGTMTVQLEDRRA